MNRFSFASLTLLGAAILSAGCGNACKQVDSTPVVYEGGTADHGIYLSTPWSDPNIPWLDFPGGRSYRIVHNLHDSHVAPVFWVAFSPHPFPAGGSGSASISPGNQSILQGIGDDYLQVTNDTCEHFYLLVSIDTGIQDIGEAGASN